MRGRRIPLQLPNTGALRRKKSISLRASLIIFLVLFIIFQYHVFSFSDDHGGGLQINDSNAAILSMVPTVFHKFLTSKTRNQTLLNQNGSQSGYNFEFYHPPNLTEIQKQIEKYNELQILLNEDAFGPLQNDSVIIVVQVHTRITYLRHLIVSLAQARDISRSLLVFSHDYYDEDINDLVQSVDFCKVMQIFYPFSIQTHPHEFPGVDPNDCPRDLNKDQALIRKCNNALYPDLYGHYREAKFTQTKHHWWWKANRVFNQLEVTRYHTGLVLFLEEDHYVAEDFLYLLDLMQKRSFQLCPGCNIISLGTYLKTFNYYTYNNKNKKHIIGQYSSNMLGNYGSKNNNNNNNMQKSYQNKNTFHYDRNSIKKFENNKKLTSNDKNNAQQTWSYHVLPSLYSVYQKVEVMPWISSKHNMGFAFNRTTWNAMRRCAQHFCSYDDYNWDWSLQHLSQQCLKKKLMAMIVRGPRVFHIGECGVHHKKKNCESNQVISKVQQVLKIARSSEQMFPRTLTLTVASLVKKSKLRKGNGGWGDRRDHSLCLNMTLVNR